MQQETSDIIGTPVLGGRHPDRRTTWIIVMAVRTAEGSTPAPSLLLDRIAMAASDAPLLASRLQDGRWIRGSPPTVTVADAACPVASAPLQAFDLSREAPLRVVASSRRDWLLLAGHHFAFDGLGMVSVLRTLLTGESEPAPDYTSLDARPHSRVPAVLRALRPAQPVAPSVSPPTSDSFASTNVNVVGPGITAGLAAACASAVYSHNASAGRPLRRIGISVAVGGIRGQAATYRRIDVSETGKVRQAVQDALSDPLVPPELKGLPAGAFLLRPILQRFSDTFLLSNLGRIDLPGVQRLEFYPVARGRSGLAIGAAGLTGGPTVLTIRSGTLSQVDADDLLRRITSALKAENAPYAQ